MSVKERLPRYAVTSDQKPACEMSPEEWETYKRQSDQDRIAEGREPINWELAGDPLPLTDAVRERALSMKLPGE